MTLLMRSGMEAIYDDVPGAIGFMRFASVQAARGTMFGAAPSRNRMLLSQELAYATWVSQLCDALPG
jgi:hypothetical protein